MGIYQNPEDRETLGHGEGCKFTTFKSSPCKCGPPSAELTASMILLGWEPDPSSTFGSGFTRSFGDHLIMVHLLTDGWQLKWARGYGYTALERRGFATVGHLLNWFWGYHAQRHDEFIKLSWEHGQMTNQLKNANIEPKVLWPDEKVTPVLRHEVTAIMSGLEKSNE